MSSRRYCLLVDPCPKPRQTFSDRWKKRPIVMKYRCFADALRLEARKHKFRVQPYGMRITFHMSMPESWSNKKREKFYLKPHQQTPDVDNLAKSVFDALCDNDCHIYEVSLKKIWDVDGFIEIICTDE